MSTPHPWRALRAMVGVDLHWRHDMPAHMRAATDGERIWMRSDLSQVERRCTLAHELEHLRRGHDGCQGGRVESVVEHHAARWLLPDPREVADALVWAAGSTREAADVLWVTERALVARLDPLHLHPAERVIIQERVARLDATA